MIKLALLARAGDDPQDLLSRRRRSIRPARGTLADQVQNTTGMDRTLALWRHEMMSATTQFLDQATGMPKSSSQISSLCSAGRYVPTSVAGAIGWPGDPDSTLTRRDWVSNIRRRARTGFLPQTDHPAITSAMTGSMGQAAGQLATTPATARRQRPGRRTSGSGCPRLP